MVSGIIFFLVCLGFICMDCLVIFSGRKKTDYDILTDAEEQKKAIDEYVAKREMRRLKRSKSK